MVNPYQAPSSTTEPTIDPKSRWRRRIGYALMALSPIFAVPAAYFFLVVLPQEASRSLYQNTIVSLAVAMFVVAGFGLGLLGIGMATERRRSIKMGAFTIVFAIATYSLLWMIAR